MKCLNCGEEMVNNLAQTKQKQIAYDMCGACGSLWLDAGELDKMAFQVAGSIEFCSRDEAEEAGRKARECPRCEGVALDVVRFLGYSDIRLGHCRNCGGFWLDGGELDLINRELESIMPVEGKGFSEFVNNVHLPYWYKRVRKKSSETDFTVDLPPLRGAQFRSETPYACPACEGDLNTYEAYGTEIEGCPACKGIWLDKEELRKLKDRSEQDSWRSLRWMDDELEAIEQANAVPSGRNCPTCTGQKLVSTSFGESSTILDWCPACHGVWLDRGEFEEILDVLRRKLDQMPVAELKEQVYKEIKEIMGGPEGSITEMLDAKAAISALVNVTIFHHPRLCSLLLRFSEAARSVGL